MNLLIRWIASLTLTPPIRSRQRLTKPAGSSPRLPALWSIS